MKFGRSPSGFAKTMLISCKSPTLKPKPLSSMFLDSQVQTKVLHLQVSIFTFLSFYCLGCVQIKFLQRLPEMTMMFEILSKTKTNSSIGSFISFETEWIQYIFEEKISFVQKRSVRGRKCWGPCGQKP